MLIGNHQQLHHIFFEFYVYQGNMLLKNDIKEQLCQIFFKFYADQK